MVVVAGEDQHRPIAECAGEIAEHRLGGGEHFADRPVAQFEHVAEQHETIDAVERADQRVENALTPQDVATRPIADVQIGDDERA
jgi:hypothetical protein